MSLSTWAINIGGEDFGDTTDVIEPAASNAAHKIMTIEGYGAAGIVELDLGNAKLQWDYDCTLYFATNAEATTFYMMGGQLWTGVNTVTISHTDYTATVTTWTITNANVTLQINRPIGLTVTCKLTITGGSITV
jgi:hypothetical protein